jgi:four helix bundle protein
MQTRNFRDLKVWEKAHQLTLDAYRATLAFPRDEAYGLASQVRRSASSVPANIAEGCGRGGGDLARFCRIASGSLSEFRYHLLLVYELGLLPKDRFDALDNQAAEVERMLTAFIRTLATHSGPDHH